METALTFNEVTLTPITHENRLWIKASELARALGYSREDTVSQIYSRNADEFTPDMTQVIEILDNNNLTFSTKARIFSPRGCHLVAMFARTRIAKKFRKWVLDVLDKVCEPSEPKQPALPPVDAPITPDQQCTLRAIVKAKVEAIPEAERPRALYPQIWSRFNNHFRIARYCQLPQTRLSEAVEYLTQMEFQAALPAKPEGLPVPVEPSIQLRTLHAAREKCRYEFIPRGYAATDLKAAQRSKLCFDLYQAQDNLWAMLYNVCSAIQHIREEA